MLVPEFCMSTTSPGRQESVPPVPKTRDQQSPVVIRTPIPMRAPLVTAISSASSGFAMNESPTASAAAISAL